MKKQIFSVLAVAFALLFVFAGCKAEEKVEKTYQSVYDEYAAKIQEAAPALTAEFKEEAAAIKDDLSAVITLYSEKIGKLSEIVTEGGSKLGEVHLEHKEDQVEYKEWSEKLTQIYTDAAQQITDVYTEITSH